MTGKPVPPPPWERPAPPAGVSERHRAGVAARVLGLAAVIVVVLGGVALLAVVLYTPRGDQVDFARLQPGQCFNRATLGPDVVTLRVVSCDTSHRHEAFAVIRYPAGAGVAFPGRDAIQELAKLSCAEPLDAYLAGSSLPTGLQFGWVYPEQRRWEKGERTIVCEVFNADGSMRSTSIRSA